MHGDGDGWTTCSLGHRHWGLQGAAGLLLRWVGPDGARVLLQHRAAWSHHGDTWGLPGGARDSHESPEQAALREAAEEAGLDPATVRVRGRHRDDHVGWCYDTVVADVAAPATPVAQHESAALVWVPEGEVTARAVHPGFALTWPRLAAPLVTLIVDGANVVGSRPDGWWHDRLGAARRLRDELAILPATVRAGPGGGWLSVGAVVLVVEGRAAALASESDSFETVRVVAAGRDEDGDDRVVSVAGQVPSPVVVTADRGLRARVPAATVAGPGWLRGLLEPAGS
ncbi:MAG TPA: NUDIX domain-containing protein [Actinomycetes bacterium]|nr:NUDIX domain-containing protein [Actinomycetes bacterium]